MGQLLNLVLFLALFIALFGSPAMVTRSGSSIRSGDKSNPWWWRTHVQINNNLGEGLNLTVHCKSGHKDIGIQVIPNGGNYEWSFKVNFLETTLYSCEFDWKPGRRGSI